MTPPADQKVFQMIRAHPAAGRQRCQWGVQAVQVKQQWTIITLDQRTDPTAPDNNSTDNQEGQSVILWNLFFPFTTLKSLFLIPISVSAAE